MTRVTIIEYTCSEEASLNKWLILACKLIFRSRNSLSVVLHAHRQQHITLRVKVRHLSFT